MHIVYVFRLLLRSETDIIRSTSYDTTESIKSSPWTQGHSNKMHLQLIYAIIWVLDLYLLCNLVHSSRQRHEGYMHWGGRLRHEGEGGRHTRQISKEKRVTGRLKMRPTAAKVFTKSNTAAARTKHQFFDTTASKWCYSLCRSEPLLRRSIVNKGKCLIKLRKIHRKFPIISQCLGENMILFILFFCAVTVRSMQTIKAIVYGFRGRIDRAMTP